MNVLMYHGVVASTTDSPLNREEGADLYDLPVEQFRLQMKWLKEHHREDIVITFDDGEMNNYLYAFPILKEYGLKASFFVIIKRIGKEGYMNWPQLKELIEAGMTVGSHGLTHEILTNLIDSQMEEELRASKKNLDFNLSINVDSLSIPRGFCNDKIIQMAHDLGYKKVFISDKSYHIKSDCFPRIAVKGNWTLKRFIMAMEGKIPLKERFTNFITRAAKTILREPGYNFVRNSIIKIIK